MAHIDLQLDLPHAGTISKRIVRIAEAVATEHERGEELAAKAQELLGILIDYQLSGENPPEPQARRVRDAAASVGREIVDLIEQLDAQDDRLGQFVRNLFECLALGEEGAEISLRAGEDPNSLQRPV